MTQTMNSTRFGLFAVSHIIWSLGCCLFGMRLLDEDSSALLLTAAGMMLAYLPLGWAVAKLTRWPKPDRKASLWAVLLPTLIAWAWAGTTAACLFWVPEGVGVGAVLGLPAFLLAVPSLLLVTVILGLTQSVLGGMAVVLAIFLAGLLPPLLFWLGSVLGGANEKTTVQRGQS